MANPTTNFGWQMPTSTDLVTDLPADFEVFGQAVDTALVDLKGGTTGQVLSKASNTNMDFTWVTSDDANAIQNAIVDAKGDLIAASANDTPARLAVGNNGETLVADSSTSTGLRYQGSMAGGKNALINGAFDYWQRGTSFTLTAGGTYTSDRWSATRQNGAGTVTRKSFPVDSSTVPNSAPNFLSFNQSTAATDYAPNIVQNIEDVRTFAGQTVTLSFYAKASKSIALSLFVYQNNGGGGGQTGLSPTVIGTATTSWSRISYTFAMPSVSGLTISAGSMTQMYLQMPLSDTYTVDFSQVQLEVGSVATSFSRAGGTLQGELAACQRYYYRQNGAGGANNAFAYQGVASATTTALIQIPLLTEMRVSPTAIDQSNLGFYTYRTGSNLAGTATLESAMPKAVIIRVTTAASLTINDAGILNQQSAGTAFLGFSAEL
jgi:hypothetical protein